MPARSLPGNPSGATLPRFCSRPFAPFPAPSAAGRGRDAQKLTVASFEHTVVLVSQTR